MNFQDKQQLIRFFLKKGYQLDNTALNLLQESNSRLEDIASQLEAIRPTIPILTGDDLRKFIEKKLIPTHVVKEPKQVAPPYSPDTVVKVLNARYNTIKEILAKKPELVNLNSINKTKHLSQFSVIGIVRDIGTGDNLLIEDNTGTLRAQLSDKEQARYVVNDEVIGFICKRDNDYVKVEKLVYPDLGLKKAVQKTQQETTLHILQYSQLGAAARAERGAETYRKWAQSLSDKDIVVVFGETDGTPELLKAIPTQAKLILVGGGVSVERENTQVVRSDATILKIDDIIIFVGGKLREKYKKQFGTSEEETVKMLLKKRHLDPTLDLTKHLHEEEPQLLDIEPDIVAISASETASINYRGTTALLVSDDKPIYWKTNLKTRETLKVDIA